MNASLYFEVNLLFLFDTNFWCLAFTDVYHFVIILIHCNLILEGASLIFLMYQCTHYWFSVSCVPLGSFFLVPSCFYFCSHVTRTSISTHMVWRSYTFFYVINGCPIYNQCLIRFMPLSNKLPIFNLMTQQSGQSLVTYHHIWTDIYMLYIGNHSHNTITQNMTILN